ncbi:CST complex subunit STN1-like [Patiria miniata]|uniref:CST complex subunit STN1 n=1 Tax=Patiria miniata TaxID=46514 RepID=A0A914A638_PATMI|nr:CST complex subunit STN1-like [Patiria miniata]
MCAKFTLFCLNINISDEMGPEKSGISDTEFLPIPKQFWHLDPVNRSYAKMYIADILQLERYPTGEGAFAYKNHPIYRVDIIGWLVRVEERTSMFQYGVDDGTGVINCCCWKSKKVDEQFGIGDGAAFSDIVLGKVANHEMRQSLCFELGDVIHVRGRLKHYRNRLEVSASYYRKLEDPCCRTEIYRMEALPNLYENVYDRPFVLPSHMVKELKVEKEAKRTGLTREAHLIDQLFNYLQSHLADRHTGIRNFHLNELETIDAVMTIASSPCLEYRNERGIGSAPSKQIRSIIKQAVQRLEKDGCVYRSGMSQDMYEVVHSSTSSLDQTILEILRYDCQLIKYEGGCHYMHVMDRLHGDRDFQNVSADTVRLALSRLEECSEVISATSKHFIPVR